MTAACPPTHWLTGRTLPSASPTPRISLTSHFCAHCTPDGPPSSPYLHARPPILFPPAPSSQWATLQGIPNPFAPAQSSSRAPPHPSSACLFSHPQPPLVSGLALLKSSPADPAARSSCPGLCPAQAHTCISSQLTPSLTTPAPQPLHLVFPWGSGLSATPVPQFVIT